MAGEVNPKAPGVATHMAVFGTNPIGTIVSWTSHLTGTPKLPQEYVQCVGQVITDTASPMHGQTVPNLSGSGGANFLSGASVSGQTGGGTNLTVSLPTTSTNIFANSTNTGSTPVDFSITTLNTTSASAANVPPAFYTVIHCMRIK